jgi:hypothetical protein
MAQLGRCVSVACRAATSRALALAALGLLGAGAPLSAQRRAKVQSHQDSWTVSLTGGGSYALSDLEIVPGTDQNGGWSWDAGLRFGRGGGSIGIGSERLRLDVGADGSGVISGVFAEPRVAWGVGWGPRPYLFAHASRIVDYDVNFCCSAYPADSNAEGWMLGGGFGVVMTPIGHIRFDLSAGASWLSGKTPDGSNGSWESSGPLMALRLGASIPLIGPE